MNLIGKDTSRSILFVGPDFKNHRGGIGAVLETYNSFIECFKFIPSFRPLGSNLEKAVFFARSVFSVVKTLMADKAVEVVHLHGSHSGSFYRKLLLMLICKGGFKKKIIYHVHSSSFNLFFQKADPISKRLIKFMFAKVDLVICLSPWWKAYYEDKFTMKRIVIVNNVVNYPVQGWIGNETEGDNLVKFLFLGRIGDRKGIFDLLDVLESNRNEFENKVKLFIGGDGEIERLKNYIEENGLGRQVEYIGWVTQEKKLAFLLGADAYILPSYNEGLPISILEAMSCGLPILATNIGGIPEVVEQNVNGILFNPGDKTAIKDAILLLIRNRQLLQNLGDASLVKIQHYLPDYVANQLVECYKSLLANE